MDLKLDTTLIEGYTSASQMARRLTEGWVSHNMYCPRCGNLCVDKTKNNSPVSDFICPECHNILELKSKNGSLTNKVNDGAYDTMVSRITSSTNPDFLFLGYNRSAMIVEDLVVIPKHFFVPSIIEKRKPLAPTARRAGWTGCNILLSSVPEQGRVSVIRSGEEIPQKHVIEKLNRSTSLSKGDIKARGWLFDVLNCVNLIHGNMFSLVDVYCFVPHLAKRHPDNHNIQAKIRQQLQMLRDAGYIEFLEPGSYRRLH